MYIHSQEAASFAETLAQKQQSAGLDTIFPDSICQLPLISHDSEIFPKLGHQNWIFRTMKGYRIEYTVFWYVFLFKRSAQSYWFSILDRKRLIHVRIALYFILTRVTFVE